MEPDLTTSLATGLPSMDANNRHLLAMLDGLAQLDDQRFPSAYCDLVALIERDFRHEEALMESIGYPAQPVHREQHARVLGGLHCAEGALLKGDCGPARRSVELLPKWLELHIVTQDAALALAAELTSQPATHLP